MEQITSHLKGVWPFLGVSCLVFIYCEDYSEYLHNSLMWTSLRALISAFSRAILTDIFALATWTGMFYYFKLAKKKFFDLLAIHVFSILMTMVVIHPGLFWVLKCFLVLGFSLVLALLLQALNFEQPIQPKTQANETYRRSEKGENIWMKTLPNQKPDLRLTTEAATVQGVFKGSVPRANVPVLFHATGDATANPSSTSAPQPEENFLRIRTSGTTAPLNPTLTQSTFEYQILPKSDQAGVPATSKIKSSSSKSTPHSAFNYLAFKTGQGNPCNPAPSDQTFSQDRPITRSQEPHKTVLSKSIQAGTAMNLLVESSTSTSSPAWSPVAVRTRQGNEYNSHFMDETLSQEMPMSGSQASVSSQATIDSHESSDWVLQELKTRAGTTYCAFLWNKKLGISKPISPSTLYHDEE